MNKRPPLNPSVYFGPTIPPTEPAKTSSQARNEAYLDVGEVVADGRYKIVKLLGRGSFGQVFLALDRKFSIGNDLSANAANLKGRTVAIKVVVPVNGYDLAFEQDELDALARMRHPNVVTVSDRFVLPQLHRCAGFLAIVMEFVPGDTLLNLISNPRKPDCLRFLQHWRQLSKGMHHVHEHGFVHRDLSLNNIKVSNTGELVIIDFGLARATERISSLRPGQTPEPIKDIVQGTPGYIAPSDWLSRLKRQPEVRPVSKRADLYAMGVLLYQMASAAGASRHPLGLWDAYERPPSSSDDRFDWDRLRQRFEHRLSQSKYLPLTAKDIADPWLRRRCDLIIQRALGIAGHRYEDAVALDAAVAELMDAYNRRQRQQQAYTVTKFAAALLCLVIGCAWTYQFIIRIHFACNQARQDQHQLPSRALLKPLLGNLREQVTSGLQPLKLQIHSIGNALWMQDTDSTAWINAAVTHVLAESKTHRRILVRRGAETELWSRETWGPIARLQLPDSLGRSLSLSVSGALFIPGAPWFLTWHDRDPWLPCVARWDTSTGAPYERTVGQTAKGREAPHLLCISASSEDTGVIEQVLATSDGKRLFLRTAKGQVWTWQAETGMTRLADAEMGALVMALSPDGQVLALAGKGKLQLYRSEGEQNPARACSVPLERPLPDSDLPDLHRIAFDATGKRMAVSSRGWNTWVLSLDEVLSSQGKECPAQLLNECRDAPIKASSHCPRIHSLAFLPAPDGVLVGRGDGRVTLWRLAGEHPSPQILEVKHEDSVKDLEVVEGGQFFVSVASDAVQAWDAKALRPFWSHPHPKRTESEKAGLRTHLYPLVPTSDGDGMLVHVQEGWLRLTNTIPLVPVVSAQSQSQATCDVLALLRDSFMTATGQTGIAPESTSWMPAVSPLCEQSEVNENVRACLRHACRVVHTDSKQTAACENDLVSARPGIRLGMPRSFGCMPRLGGAL